MESLFTLVVGIRKFPTATYLILMLNLGFISKNKGGFVIFHVLALNWLSAQAGETGVSFMGPSKSNRRQLEAAA